MSKIIRTKSKAHGGITADEKRRMDEHAKLWISRAMRTAPIQPDKIIPAIEGLYEVAGLKKPRVVIVPSPMVMAFAYGASAAIWHARKNPKATHAATDAATHAATDAATYDATRAATYDATRAATDAATHAATYAATYAATDAATHAATDAATYDATRAATYDATRAATDAATHAATYAATYAATDAATRAATRAATYAATDAATYAATYAATHAATRAATDAATDAATYAATDAATRAATRATTYAAADAATYAATYAATDAATYAATDAATYAATYAATDAATRAATDAATHAATHAATYAATYAATDAATYAATDAATYAATRAATRAATDAATYAATDAATRAATHAATDDVDKQAAQACFDLAGPLGMECARRWWNVYHGGNMWAGYDGYLTACRDILGLELREHAGYSYWEQAAIHGGFRVMHEEFCLVSDFPEVILKDEENRPHCETGPSHRWRDGWSLYHFHGVKVPAEWIENRATLDPAIVLKASNVEQRAAGAAIIGWPKMVSKLKRKVIDGDPDTDMGALIELTLPGLREPGRFLQARCPRNGTIVEGVPRISDIDNLPIETVIAAQAWRVGDPQSEYEHPSIRT